MDNFYDNTDFDTEQSKTTNMLESVPFFYEEMVYYHKHAGVKM